MLLALTGLLWGALILSASSSLKKNPGPTTVAVVLSGVSLAVYYLIRDRRYAIELSMLCAYLVVVATMATVVILLQGLGSLLDWIELGHGP